MRDALIVNIREILERNQEQSRPTFIVIDGPAGAGKTTLANELIESFGIGEIIHGDDLYNGWNDALSDTLVRNIEEWILKPLRNDLMPSYQKFNWHSEKFDRTIQVPRTPLIILEGVGVALKGATDIADLAIWIDIPHTLGLERVLLRDGSGIQSHMIDWLEQQSEFFKRHHNRDNCGVHLPYGAPAHP